MEFNASVQIKEQLSPAASSEKMERDSSLYIRANCSEAVPILHYIPTIPSQPKCDISPLGTDKFKYPGLAPSLRLLSHPRSQNKWFNDLRRDYQGYRKYGRRGTDQDQDHYVAQRAEHWVSLSSAIELSNLTDWEIVSESYNPLGLSSMLYVLAMRADKAMLLLLRGKCSGSRRLFLAPTFDGNIYQLGDASFHEQIRRGTSGEVAFDGSKFLVYPEELYLMVHGYISLESIADIQACQCWSGNGGCAIL
jgi:hypothetical protein